MTVRRVRPCTEAVVRGRLEKARAFTEASMIIQEWLPEDDALADADATLSVQAGIAAACDLLRRDRLARAWREP